MLIGENLRIPIKKQPLIPISKPPPVPIQTLPNFERLGSAKTGQTALNFKIVMFL
jgi:hypothetical protein